MPEYLFKFHNYSFYIETTNIEGHKTRRVNLFFASFHVVCSINYYFLL